MKKYELGMYEKAVPKTLSWEEKLCAAKGAGYDYVELSIDETDEKLARLDWSSKERFELVKLTSEIGMPIRSICLSGHRRYPLGSSNPEIERKSMEIMEKALILATDLGIRIVQLAGYDVYYEDESKETDARFRKNLIKATEMAAKYGVMMGFETMENEYMNTVYKAIQFVDEIKSPYLGVYPDSGNITNAAFTYKKSVIDDLMCGKGHIIAVHLKETIPGKFREIPFGTGHVDFKKIISTAWDLGVRKYVTELWYTGNENWMEDIKFSRKMMGDILDAIQCSSD